MGSCLKDYVFQKFPISVVTSVIKNKGMFELRDNQLCGYGNSIDNEISQIANTIDNFNKLNSTNISYTSLHFATDYLKSRNELDKQVELNLSNNRCELAKSCKEVVTKKIISLLLEYLSMK